MFYNKPHATAKWGTMAMDWEFQDTLMHRAGNMLKQTVQQCIKDAGLDRYSV